MSEFHIRNLAAACAPRIAAKVEAVVLQTIRDELPGTIAEVLREQYAGEKFSIWVPKRSPAAQRDRNAAIRARYNGHNAASLSAEFSISIRQVMRLVAGR